MSKHTTQTEDHTPESPPVETPPVRQSSLPVVFSVLALLLAALALAANLLGNKTVQTDPTQIMSSKLGQIESRIGDVEAQMTNDKLDVVNSQLKQMLMNLKQLSRIADDATRARIERAYKQLEPLVTSARVKAEIDLQSIVAPENQSSPAAEPTASPSAIDMPAQQEEATITMPQPTPDSTPLKNQPTKITAPSAGAAPTATDIP